MKAIVTGATGFLGGHLIPMLVDHGFQVIAMGRNNTIGESLVNESVSFKQVDIRFYEQVVQVFEAVDVVFHCAALSDVWGDYKKFFDVNVKGTENILECCKKFKVKRLVHVSTTSVYFDFRDKLNINENEILKDGFANHYARTKALAEEKLKKNSENVEVVIIRPRGIVGDGDTSIMPRILRVSRKGIFPLINNGRALIDITYVKNVAHALVLAARKEDVDGMCFNISNMEPMTVKELLNKVFSSTGIEVNFINVNYYLISFAAVILEGIYKLFHLGEPAITKYSVGLLSKTQTLNTDLASSYLGYKPIYSLDHAINEYARWESESV